MGGIRVLRRLRELLDVDQATTPADADVVIWNAAQQEFTFGPPPGVGSGTPTGPAGGDLSGTYPNPQIAAGAVGSAEIANGSIAIGDLAFDPATQAELDAEAASRAAADTANANALAAHLADATDAHDASAVSIVDTGSFYTGTDVEAALQELGGSIGGGGPPSGPAGGVLSGTYPNPGFAVDMATQAELDAHTGDLTDAHDASAISVDPTGLVAVSGDDVQEAIGELDSAIADHIADPADAHAASAVSFTPSGNLVATNVDAALQELDSEKAAAASAILDGDAAGGVLAGTYPNPSFAADMATQAELDAHINDATDAHDASAISYAGNAALSSADVESALDELDNEKQPLDSDLTAIAGLSPTNDDIVQRKAGAWTNRTMAQLRADLGNDDIQYETRSTNTILGVADKGKVIDITATITQTFEADETLGDGWWVILRNATDDGTTVVTLNPAGSETIDGLTTVTMYSGECRLIICNGANGNFNSILKQGGFARFTADDNFIVPHGITTVTVDAVGAGGGGGGGKGAAAGNARPGGSGGGGGGREVVTIPASQLGNPGDTIAVDVGAGGTSGAGGSSGNGSNGGAGDNTTFGSFLTAYGGGGGIGNTNTGTNNTGGGGGGAGEKGTIGQQGSGSRGGGSQQVGVSGMGSVGGGCSSSNGGVGHGEYGGGAGGVVNGTGANGNSGATSMWGGGGGGGGGGVTSGNVESVGSAGGQGGAFSNVGGGGGSAGAVNGGGGGNGADGDLRVCGSGGGSGGGQDSGTGGAGGNGGAVGGGGGGGGGGTSTGGAGGVGGRGECRVWYG